MAAKAKTPEAPGAKAPAPPSLLNQDAAAQAASASAEAAATPLEQAVKDKADKSGLPSVAEIMASGFSEAEAYGELVAEMAGLCDMAAERVKALKEAVVQAFTAKAITGVAGKPCEPYYRCIATTPHGIFHAAGRKFSNDPKDPANSVKEKDLLPHEVQDLKNVNPRFLAVQRVVFE